MLRKIISGAQIGADIAALRAAKKLGLETGGWMPAGFVARDGVHPEYAEVYGIKEHPSPKYPPRTEANVFAADATIRFAYNFATAGERCTLNAIRRYGKPYFDVSISSGPRCIEENPKSLEYWLRSNDFGILNVAGNASPWIEPIVENYLLTAIASPHVLKA